MPTLPEIPAADRERLLARSVARPGLADADLYVGREDELRTYLVRSRGRYAVSLELVLGLLRGRTRPACSSSARNTGSSRSCSPSMASSRRAPVADLGSGARTRRCRARTMSSSRGPAHEVALEHHLFDVERDRWPFAEGSFDVVVCMEVLEHLAFSPAHLLYEANRVLAPGGALLLTTPNVLAATKLVRLGARPQRALGLLGLRPDREAQPRVDAGRAGRGPARRRLRRRATGRERRRLREHGRGAARPARGRRAAAGVAARPPLCDRARRPAARDLAPAGALPLVRPRLAPGGRRRALADELDAAG